MWESATWLHYSGDSNASIVPRPFCYVIMCTLAGVVEPGWSAVQLKPITGFEESGLLLHVEAAHADEFTFASRIRDVSRESESAGTEVDVVREDAMHARPLYLLNVPVGPTFRGMLRIWALPETENPQVEVRYYRNPIDEPSHLDPSLVLLKSERVALTMHEGMLGYALRPSAAQIANFDAYPELAAERAIWIEVVPLTQGLRIWSMASVTNNDTQQVTIIAPR